MPINILMPALSPTMEKGNLAKWLKKEGDKVKSGDVIAEIETDKATMEVEAVDEGTIAKILVPEGTQDVPVNDVIAVLAGDGEDVKAAGAAPQQKSEAKSEPKAEAKPEVYCMSVLETHDCKCISDQGTEVMMPVVQCRTIARYGLYNPFRRPIEDRITGRTDRPEQRAQPERSRPEIVEAEETAATANAHGRSAPRPEA